MAFSKIAAENLGGSTLPALAGGSLTGIGGGITVCDHWYLASSTDNGTNGIIADSGGSGANGGAWTKYQSATGSVTTVTTGSVCPSFSLYKSNHESP